MSDGAIIKDATIKGLGAKPQLPKRFYKEATAMPAEGGFALALDGKTARTPARAPLVVPSEVLARAIAQEWAGQGEFIDPATMPLTKIANAAIDGVAREMEAVAAEIVKYAGSDLVCYRADGPDRLVARQSSAWDPVVAFARDDLGARFTLAEGVMYVEQSDEAIGAVGRAIPREDPFLLAGLSVITTLTGSALLALAVLRGALTPEAAWEAAEVDEAWSAEVWGVDAEAEARRAARRIEMMAAAQMLAGRAAC